MSISLFRIAAMLCFLAVALGAFGAHSLKSSLEMRGMLDVWNKAALYHFIHAIALLVLALYGTINRGAWWKRAADRKSTRLNSSHRTSSYAVFCLKRKKGSVSK